MSDATYIPCMYLGDDETILTALKQAIEDEDSPELLRVQPFGKDEAGGLWVRTNLVSPGEIEKAKTEKRLYRDDRSMLEWVWSPDEVYAELEKAKEESLNQTAYAEGWQQHVGDLMDAMKPFVTIMKESSGRIPTERLSAANWHALVKAFDVAASAFAVEREPNHV